MQAHKQVFGNNLVGIDNTRYYKHLLAETCIKVDSNDSSWTTNGAGNTFSNKYGFGCVDALALCNAAQKFTGVTELETYSTGTIDCGSTLIPLANSVGISKSVTVDGADLSQKQLEEVCLRVVFPAYILIPPENVQLGGCDNFEILG
jgi:hypothetical protein